MLALLEIIKKTTDYLASKGIESPRLNAELLISHALGLKRMQLYVQFERLLTEPELAAIRPLVKRRSAREPLQYIVGETEWCGLRLKVDRRALIPRPETEYLFELVQERVASPPAAVLDLGTGTGALALAAATCWPDARVTAVDLHEEALSLARENTERLHLGERVRLVRSHWCESLPAGETFDLILSNPPYLTSGELDEAEPEVKDHEPRSALVAEEEGRADLALLLAQCRQRIAPDGLLALETGIAHHAWLQEQARMFGWGATESARDLTGRDRFVFARP
ncbi:MAG: peptide chain release factor N(5)-glutamine methyltransferase [Opitutaceae bacterium]|nr:peptide chain release factor N(5)-glutamine methyltransferase [Opitutaceae bacterium]